MTTLRVGNIEALGGTGTITVPAGNKIKQAGAILQILQTVKTDAFSTTSTTLTDVTGLSVSITPTLSSSKVLVVVQVGISGDASGTASPYISLLRGSTEIYLGDAAGSRPRVSYGLNGTTVNIGYGIWQGTLIYLDSPATTTATTYKIQMRTSAGGTVCLNRTLADTDNSQFPRTPSTITVLEVGV